MPGRVVTITALGNTRDLEAAFRRAGLVVSESANTMADSAKRAGAAAAASAKQVGAAADAQAAAAGRAAAAVVDAQAKMSRAQKAASDAAASAAKTAGLSADEQVAAAKRAADAQKAAADASKAAADAHAKLSKAGGVVALGLAGAAVEAVKLGMAYQTAQASIQGATGQSVKEVGKLTGAFTVMGTGSQAAVGSGQQMEAAYASVAAQLKLTEGHALNTAEATKFASAANNLAESGAASVAEAYSATAKVMQTFGLSADHAAEVTDTLYSTSNAVKVPVEQVASAMGKLHAALGAVAPSMRDISGTMVALGKEGLTGGRGVQVVGSAFQTLLGSSKPVHSVLKDLGVTLTDSSGKFIGMQNAIALLQPKLAALPESERRYAEQTLLGKGATEKLGQVILAGVPAFERATQAANKHAAAQKAAEAQGKTFHDQMEALKHTVETLGGSFGLILIPDIQKVAKALSDGIQWLEKHKDAAKALGVVITSVLGAAMTVFAYDKAVAFGKGVQRMTEGLKSLVTSSGATAASVEADQAAQAAAVEASAAKVEAANVTAGASFTGVGGAAVTGEAEVGGAVAGGATAVGTADTAIEGSNALAGASFKALAAGAIKYLGMIGAAFLTAEAGAHAFGAALSAITGEHQPESLGELVGGTQPGEKSFAEADKRAGQFGAKATPGQLGKSNQYGFIAEIAKRYGISPNTLWGIYGTETSYGANITTSKTGAKGGFQFEPETAKAYGYPLTNHPDAKQFQAQAEAAARDIASNTRKYHSEAKAVEAYYAGHPGGQGDYLHKVEAAGGAHYGKAQEEELKAVSPGSNAALQQQIEEASGARPKAKKAETVHEYLGPNGEVLKETAAQHSHRSLMERKAKLKAGGAYVAPLAHPQITREDMGIDFAAHPGEQVKSIGQGVIKTILANWYKGQPLIEEELTQGAHKGQNVYYAEQLRSKVREGQHVAAGQAIATVAPSGTGLEFGFAAGHGKTLAQATTGFKDKEGNDPTPASKAYAKFLESIGKSGSVLNAVAVAQETATKAEAKRLTALESAGKKLLGEGTPRGSLQSAIQSGSVAQLEKILGVTTGGKRLAGELQEPLTQAHLEHQVMPTLAKSAEVTGTGKAFDKLVTELKTVHTSGARNMVIALQQAHKQALADLGRELYAVTQEREAAALTNEATEQKDRTTQTANLAAKQLQVTRDQSTQITDAMTGAAKQIDDATQIMKDSFAEMAEAVSLATQKMSDAASGEVTKTQDETATKVAELGERGKYGLELIAQKLEVQLDQMKAQYDVQIQQAKMAVDQAKISGQSLIAERQQNVDLLQAHEDALVTTAQAHSDAVQVAQDQQEATAQAQLDSVQLASDIGIDLAKTAQALVASGTKAQQDAAKGFAAYAQSHGEKQLADADAHVKAVEAAANATIQQAQGALAQAQGESAQAISNAQQALAAAEGAAHIAIANAEQGLASIEGTAKTAEAVLEGKVAIERERAQTQYAGSGLVVNQYGMNPTDAAANAAELGWVLRSLTPL